MLLIINRPPNVTLTTSLFPYTTLFRSGGVRPGLWIVAEVDHLHAGLEILVAALERAALDIATSTGDAGTIADAELELGGHQMRIKRHPAREQHDQRERAPRSEEHTSELQSLMRISYAVFCLKKKNSKNKE